MKIQIKNLVSSTAKILVKEEFEKLGLHVVDVKVGEVEILEKITPELHDQLSATLMHWGLELLNNRRNILVEKIKSTVVEMVHYSENQPRINFSEYLSEKIGHNYTYLANIFSEVTGTTIEHYIIAHKIEKVKELLVYDELCLSEIAFKMNYSSVAHLSSQFKHVTGLTISHFRELEQKQLFELENVGMMQFN